MPKKLPKTDNTDVLSGIASSVRPSPHWSWLQTSPLYLVRSGSWAYGMATDNSDVDIKGFVVPPSHLGGLGFQDFEQLEFKGEVRSNSVGWPERPAEWPEKAQLPAEGVVYGVKKFLRLAAGANPNILEVLFARDSDALVRHSVFDVLRDNRDLFLSQQVRSTYLGYARAQLKRVESHRSWLLNPPSKKPQRADFGLRGTAVPSSGDLAKAQAEIRRKLDEWELDLSGLSQDQRQHIVQTLEEQWLAKSQKHELAIEVSGITGNLTEQLRQEKAYRDASSNWKSYQAWQQGRNVARAALEAKCGYDAKHGSHCLRLLRQGQEILEHGRLTVNRQEAGDAEYLQKVRRGEVPYEELMAEVAQASIRLQETTVHRSVPKKCDRAAVEGVLSRILAGCY